MRLKLKKSILSLALLFIGFTLFSCVEEPYVEPVKETFSEIRVVNLSLNVPNMRITIDEAQPNAGLNGLAIPSTTDYFDINPGKRVFKIFDENNNLLYSTTIEILSWTRVTIVFSGFLSTDELQNTFGGFLYDEGEVYKSSSPAPGTSYSFVINGVAAYDTFTVQPYRTGLLPAGAAPIYIGEVSYQGTIAADSVLPAPYGFYYASDAGDSTVVNTTINENLRYFYFLYGRPDDVQVFVTEIVPPPARDRG